METKKIIEKILELRGYALSDENNVIIATKGNTRVAIAWVENEKQITRFYDLVNTKADKKILVCFVLLDSEIQAQVKSLDIILWDKELLEKELGKAIIGSDSSFEKLESRHIFLKSKLDREDAELEVKHLSLNSLTLNFSPYYVYKYTCQTFEEGCLDTKEIKGIIGINGIDGSYKILKELDEQTLTEPKPDAVKSALKLSESSASKLARQALVELNTKVIEVRDERARAIIFEKRKVAPSDDTISLTPIGIWYIPFWHAKGKLGTAIIDGITGEIAKEDVIQGAPDEKIEVV
ncbi:MAG: hypothetical protein QMD21_06470 [Candidatus Thermoplasmatota archaeon]|nr:hypothetical protein [Candidatus Thermoplasmatota archaeon]